VEDEKEVETGDKEDEDVMAIDGDDEQWFEEYLEAEKAVLNNSK
jgi:hypothetical protein